MNNQFSLGARKSQKDSRTLKTKHLPTTAGELVKGGVEYKPEDILDQHNVGICTAISYIQNRNKANGKKYSPDFQYFLQKKYYDNLVYTDWPQWEEGSSNLHALKVGKRFGHLLEKDFCDLQGKPYITEADRKLSYADYIAKLKAIPEAEIERLLSLCIDKIGGYALANSKDPQDIALAIKNSKVGVTCMYQVGKEWWTPSHKEKDISPLRPPVKIISGHAVCQTPFDFTMYNLFTIPNTWGIDWCRLGCADIIWDQYKPIEVWQIYENDTPIIKPFNTDLKFGMNNDEVRNMQCFLKIKGFFNYNPTGWFGPLTSMAVKAFQKARGIPSTGYWGILSRTQANKEIS